MLAKDFLAGQLTFEGIVCALVGFGLIGTSIGIMAMEIDKLTEEEAT